MSTENMAVREAHYERHFGTKPDKVWHTTDAFDPHVDIYPFPPTDARPYWTIVTGGMSDRPQQLPPGAGKDISALTEIIMYAREPKKWMIDSLSRLAEYPWRFDTFLHQWHSFDSEEPLIKGCIFTGFVCLPPFSEPETFDTLCLPEGKVDFLWAVPLTKAEIAYKVKHGANALMTIFRKKRMGHIIDENRKSLV